MTALAVPSEQGGITGWLLELVDTLGPVGVGISVLLETVVPPIPSEAVLGLSGVLINQGRMVPIVRSFVSVPAGVVRMPLGRFVLLTTAGSLIWNTVLVGLGVAAGDLIEENLQYLDHLVVAAVVVAVGWFVYRKASAKLDRPRTAGSDLPADDWNPA